MVCGNSGDPIKIIFGDDNGETEADRKGLIECLWETFGGTVNAKGYKVLDSHIGAIYGDGITIDIAKEIFERLEAKGFAASNIVYGVGSYTYTYVTRDTFGKALKSTYAVVNGEEIMLFKDPKTDNGLKRSQRGLVLVYRDETTGEIVFKDGYLRNDFEKVKDKHLMKTVFENGKLLLDRTWDGIIPSIFTCDAFFGFRANGDYSKISTTINWNLRLNNIDLEYYEEGELEDLGLKGFDGYKESLLNTHFILSFDLDNSKAYLIAHREDVLLFDKELCDLNLADDISIYNVNFTNDVFEIIIDSLNCKVDLTEVTEWVR